MNPQDLHPGNLPSKFSELQHTKAIAQNAPRISEGVLRQRLVTDAPFSLEVKRCALSLPYMRRHRQGPNRGT